MYELLTYDRQMYITFTPKYFQEMDYSVGCWGMWVFFFFVLFNFVEKVIKHYKLYLLLVVNIFVICQMYSYM